MAELRDAINAVESADAREALVQAIAVNFHLFTRVFTAI